MTVTTKINPGDNVYVMFNNKPIKLTVDKIQININLYDGKLVHAIIYYCEGLGFYNGLKENEFFLTMEDLKNDLFK